MKKLILIGSSLLLPVVTFAADGDLSTFENMAQSLGTIVGTLIPVAFGVGLLVFFWGLIKYIFGAEGDKSSAKKTMVWGVVAIFIMASIWGIVTFIGNAFGLEDPGSIDVPKIGGLDY